MVLRTQIEVYLVGSNYLPVQFTVLFVCISATREVNFNITSWKSCVETDSRRLANGIDAAMDSMKRLLEDNFRLNKARCWDNRTLMSCNPLRFYSYFLFI